MTTATITNQLTDFARLRRVYFRAADTDVPELTLSTKAETDAALLRDLRALVPRRGLSPAEARQVAERQANLLLKRSGITEPKVGESLIAELEVVEVAYRNNWPTSGMSRQLDDGSWAIFIRGSEAKVRQRFTLAHEFKHVLDDPFIEWLYPSVWNSNPESRAETVCDYFAACLLMPKVWLRRDWTTLTQNTRSLARRYGVSVQAMEYRLTQLGLLEPRPRCAGTTRQGVTS